MSRWDQYFCEVDGSTASFVLDLDLFAQAPIRTRPYVLRIRIRMIDPREDGLSSDEEAQTLGEIESALESAIGVCAVLAGRYTVNKVRTIVFYCDDESRVDLVAPVFRDLYPFHKHTAFVQEDVEWVTYCEFLYPDLLTLRSMTNRDQCARMGWPGPGIDHHHIIVTDDEYRIRDKGEAWRLAADGGIYALRYGGKYKLRRIRRTRLGDTRP